MGEKKHCSCKKSKCTSCTKCDSCKPWLPKKKCCTPKKNCCKPKKKCCKKKCRKEIICCYNTGNPRPCGYVDPGTSGTTFYAEHASVVGGRLNAGTGTPMATIDFDPLTTISRCNTRCGTYRTTKWCC